MYMQYYLTDPQWKHWCYMYRFQKYQTSIDCTAFHKFYIHSHNRNQQCLASTFQRTLVKSFIHLPQHTTFLSQQAILQSPTIHHLLTEL